MESWVELAYATKRDPAQRGDDMAALRGRLDTRLVLRGLVTRIARALVSIHHDQCVPGRSARASSEGRDPPHLDDTRTSRLPSSPDGSCQRSQIDKPKQSGAASG
jgi:hypothetical protein